MYCNIIMLNQSVYNRLLRKAYRRFNPYTLIYSLFQMNTLQPHDTSTHDIETFQPLPVQTLQPMISRRFNPYLFRHFNPWYRDVSTLTCSDISTHVLNSFNPYIYLFQPLSLRLVNPYIEDVSTIVKPIFTGNKCDKYPIKNVYIVKTLCYVCWMC